jgi:hypothetical protein
MKTIAIHQPNFIPWLGYFMKMNLCDAFVFHDNIEITKNGPTRRVKISANHTLDHSQWLTIPLKAHSDFTLIKDLEISWQTEWCSKHLTQIYHVYKSCPYFAVNYSLLKQWYSEARLFVNLSELNIYFIKNVAEQLGIKKEWYLSSQLPITGKSSAYNLAITQYLNGTQYLSGKGGDNYQEDDIFNNNEIIIKRLDAKSILESNPYQQHSKPSNMGLSVLDSLMNIGLDETKLLLTLIKSDTN